MRIFKSGLEGDVSGHNVTIAYRTGWFVPPMQIAYFRGRVLGEDTGTKVLGDLHFSWLVYLFAGFFILGPLITIVVGIDSRDLSDVLPSIAGAAVAFLLGKLYVNAAGRGIIDDICKAIRGSIDCGS